MSPGAMRFPVAARMRYALRESFGVWMMSGSGEDAARAFRDFSGGTVPVGWEVTRLPGDASNRSYFRLSGPGRFMVMKLAAEPFSSEEGPSGGASRRLPFCDVADYLSRGNVAVPEILVTDLDAGFLVLEDLGDVTLERALAAGGNRRDLYRWAIDVLVDMQYWAFLNPDPSNVAFKRSFDADLLMWEFDHFREWGLGEMCGREPDAADSALLKAFFQDVTSRLTAMRQGFVHRDYQSRNLMIKDGRMRVIDFQDALVGPFIYDLVALLRDSYVKFSPSEVDDFLSYYHEVGRPLMPWIPDIEEIRRLFHLQALQRKLKDAGRFVFIDRVKGNPKFLPNIPQSLAYVAEAFDHLPEYAQARAVLKRYLPEHF